MDLPVTIILLLMGMVVSAVICISISDLLKAAIGLAATSALLAVIMFVLDAPLAAVFELSVCSGFITVIFISAISMTRIRTKAETEAREKERLKRFIYLPVLLLVICTVLLFVLWPHIYTAVPPVSEPTGMTAQEVLWETRQADLLGQIAIILAGVFGVIVFFKESDTK